MSKRCLPSFLLFSCLLLSSLYFTSILQITRLIFFGFFFLFCVNCLITWLLAPYLFFIKYVGRDICPSFFWLFFSFLLISLMSVPQVNWLSSLIFSLVFFSLFFYFLLCKFLESFSYFSCLLYCVNSSSHLVLHSLSSPLISFPFFSYLFCQFLESSNSFPFLFFSSLLYCISSSSHLTSSLYFSFHTFFQMQPTRLQEG